MTEVVSSGPDRLIVYEGSEERLKQITVGFLERVGLGKAPWEKDNEYAPPAPVRTENQLPSGQREPLQAPAMRRPERVSEPVEETWDEDNWEPVEARQPQAPQKARLYQDDDAEDNWSNASVNNPISNAIKNPIDDSNLIPEGDYETMDYATVNDVDATVVEAVISPPIQASAVEIDESAEIESAAIPKSDSDPWTDEDGGDEATRPKLNIPERVQEPEDA